MENKRERKQSPKSRQWFFTIHEFEDYWPTMTRDGIRYIIVQGEEGEEKGKSHWQGFMQTNDNITLKMAQRLLTPFKPTMHMEMAKHPDAVRNYCKKEATRIVEPREYGVYCPGQGHRTDISFAARLLKNGHSIRKLVELVPETYIKYHRGLEKMEAILLEQEERPAPVVEWLYGPAGTGKSRAAAQENKGAYWKGPGKWWDGYRPKIHKTVIIDEWTPDHGIGQGMLLQLLERNPVNVEPKGCSLPFLAEKIVITSNYAPENAVGPTQVEPLQRRIHRLRQFVVLEDADHRDQ